MKRQRQNSTRDVRVPLNGFQVEIRSKMREAPASALAYRNALWAEGLRLLDKAVTKRRREKIEMALAAIDDAFTRHMATYREAAEVAPLSVAA